LVSDRLAESTTKGRIKTICKFHLNTLRWIPYGDGPLPGGGELLPGGPPVDVDVITDGSFVEKGGGELLPGGPTGVGVYTMKSSVGEGDGEVLSKGPVTGVGVMFAKLSVAEGVNEFSKAAVEAMSGVPTARPIIGKYPPASRIFSPAEMIWNCIAIPGDNALPIQETLIEEFIAFRQL
jgi:hypothetical protein